MDIGSMEDCIRMMVEAMKALGQRNSKGAINNFYF